MYIPTISETLAKIKSWFVEEEEVVYYSELDDLGDYPCIAEELKKAKEDKSD